MKLHDNLCQALRQKMKDEKMNQTSFSSVNQQTVSSIVNGRGNVSTLCRVLGDLGVNEVQFDKNVIIFK